MNTILVRLSGVFTSRITTGFSRRARIFRAAMTAALLFSLLWSRPARAQTSSDEWGMFDALAAAASVGANVALSAPMVANTVYVVQSKRPPLVWPILGYSFGSLQALMGVAGLTSGLRPTRMVVGVPSVICAGLNFGMATWALLLPRAQPKMASSFEFLKHMTVAPFVDKDIAGRPMNGAVLSLTNF